MQHAVKEELRPSTAGLIHTAISSLEEHVNRLQDITNRYVGEVPENPLAPKPSILCPGGLIGEIYAAEERIRTLVSKLESCCDRLNGGL